MNIINIAKRWLVFLSGLCTCLFAVLLNFYIQDTTSINIFSFSFWFVLPVGAVTIGMLAGSGYYLSSFFINKMPDKYDFLIMLLLSITTMLLIYYIEYYFYVVKQGVGISFYEYVVYVTQNSQY